MRFENIHIDGFGCLRNVDFTLAPGLNVLYGLNEVGKSTLQQAIWALLYGFYKADRRAKGDNEMLERFRPWQGETYGGHLVYRLDNGKTFRVRRSFEDQDQTTTISEADTGREITNTFTRGKLGRVNFAREHFGMSEEVFINTCFVRQSELHHLAEAAQEITETVVNLSATGRQDRSVMKALALLDAALSEQVGSTRSRKTPLPLALERRQQLLHEKQRNIEARHALETDYERRGEILRSQEQANRDLRRLQYSRVANLRDQVSAQLEALQKLLTRQVELTNRLALLGASDEGILGQRETVLRLNQAWKGRRDEWGRVSNTISANSAEVNALKLKRQALAEAQLQFETARSIPVDREPATRELQQQWRDALSSVEQVEATHRRAQERITQLKAARGSSGSAINAIQAGQQQIQTLRIRWEGAARELATANQGIQATDEAWQRLTLAEPAYTVLQTRLAGFSFEGLAALKGERVAAGRTEAPAGQNARALGWVLLAGGVLVLIGGAVAALAGFGSGLPLLNSLGVLGILVGVVGSAAGVVLLLQRVAAPAPASALEVFRPTNLRGYGTLVDLEAAYHRFLQAQPPYENLARSRAALAERQAELAQIVSDARALLHLNPEQPVSATLLENADQTAQSLETQLKELAEVERQTGELEERLRAARELLVQREAPLKEMLEALSIDGSALTQRLQRFYDLCAKRREWDRLTADLRSVDAELKLHFAREGDASTATLAEAEARRQLLAVLAQLGVGGDDPHQAFEAFEAQCAQAALGQGLRRELETLEREIRAGLAGHSQDDLQQRRDTLAHEAESLRAALVDRNLPPESAPPEILERKIDDLRSRLEQSGKEFATVEQRLAIGSAGQRSLAEVCPRPIKLSKNRPERA